MSWASGGGPHQAQRANQQSGQVTNAAVGLGEVELVNVEPTARPGSSSAIGRGYLRFTRSAPSLERADKLESRAGRPRSVLIEVTERQAIDHGVIEADGVPWDVPVLVATPQLS